MATRVVGGKWWVRFGFGLFEVLGFLVWPFSGKRISDGGVGVFNIKPPTQELRVGLEPAVFVQLRLKTGC